MSTTPAPSPETQPIADAWVHVQCAYTSLQRLRETGLYAREGPFFARLGPRFKTLVIVSYGQADGLLARSLAPPGFEGQVVSIDNAQGLEPARFQASVPGRVCRALDEASAASALVYTDQHYGGEVAVASARELRRAGVRTGLIARGGYHWSRFESHDSGSASGTAARAAALEGELCRAADLVIGSTRGMVDDLAWRHALHAERFRLIPNFVLDAGPAPDFDGRDKGLVLSVGRLEAQKRHDLLIRAFAAVAPRFADARLVIIGEGTQREALERLIAELKVPAEIRPRIGHEQLRGLMRTCRAYAQVSSLEGHPKAIIEALSAGAPTLVTRAPGVDDEVTPGVTGLVCRGTPESVAQGLTDLLADEALSRQLSKAASADIASRLSLEAVLPEYERAMTDAMESAGAGTAVPAATVRFDQTLLNVPPRVGAMEFVGAVAAFARRLSDDDREVFLDTLATRLDLKAPTQA